MAAGYTGKAGAKVKLTGKISECFLHGKSAYEMAVERGYTGTEEEWMNAFIRGERGYSAYELAVQGGYEGTQEEWLASLRGEKPQITADKAEGVTTIKVDGETVATVENGEDGKGIKSAYIGEDYKLHLEYTDNTEFESEQPLRGAKGAAPVKGVDYWTAEDIAAVTEAACQAAIAAYPIAEEVDF